MSIEMDQMDGFLEEIDKIMEIDFMLQMTFLALGAMIAMCFYIKLYAFGIVGILLALSYVPTRYRIHKKIRGTMGRFRVSV